VIAQRNSEALSSRSSVRVVFLVVLLVGLGVSACSKQIIVPKVTPDPTQLELYGKFVWFDLFTDDLGEVNESRWVGYMSVADVDRAARRVEQNGGSIYIKPKDLPERGRVAAVKDPEGAIFAILRASDGDPPDEGAIENHWLGSELWTTNPDGAREFYSSLVGYEQQLVDAGADSKYRLLVKDEQSRAGIVKIPWEGIEPEWVPYVAVSDTAAIVEKAVKLGARVLIEPDGTNRAGAIAIIADPSGAVFAVQQL